MAKRITENASVASKSELLVEKMIHFLHWFYHAKEIKSFYVTSITGFFVCFFYYLFILKT